MKKPIKLGVMLPPSNVYPKLPSNLLNAVELYFEEKGYEAADRRIELVPLEVEVNASKLPDRMHRLLNVDRVDMVIGCIAAFALEECGANVTTARVPLISATTGATVPKNVQMHPYVFRNTLSLWQSDYALAERCVRDHGKRAMLAAILLNAGYDCYTALHQGTHAAEGTIARWHVGDAAGAYTLEMEPVVNSAREVKPDFIIATACGGKAVEMIKAFRDAEAEISKIPLAATAYAVEGPNLAELGAQGVGIRSALGWADGLKHEEHVQFCESFEEWAETPADGFAALGYDTARLAHEAMLAVEGDMKRKDDLLAALNAAEFTGPRGKVKMDPETRTMTGPVYLREFQAVGDDFKNIAIGELEVPGERDECMRELYENENMQWTNEYLCI